MSNVLIESDIELLLVRKPYLIVEAPIGATRQAQIGKFKIDLLIEDESGTTYVIEIKRYRANHGTINQVSEYYEALRQDNANGRFVPMIVAPEIPLETRLEAENKGVLWKELAYDLLSRELGRPIAPASVTRRSVGTGMILRPAKPCIIDGVTYQRKPAIATLEVYRKVTAIWNTIYGNKPEKCRSWIYRFPYNLYRGKGNMGFILLFVDQTTTYLDSIQFYLQYLVDLGAPPDKAWEWHHTLVSGITAATPIKNSNNDDINVTVRNIQMDGCIAPNEYDLLADVLSDMKATLSA